MSNLKQALADYLTIRRAFGYKLEDTERLLSGFVDHLEEAGAQTATIALAMSWVKLSSSSSLMRARKMTMVRGFARYLQTLDPDNEIPPDDLLPAAAQRATPYLYSDDDICRLLAAARNLRLPIRAATYETLFGLLAVTGLRVGEAIGLDRKDVNLQEGRLTVRYAKFGKSRELVLQSTTTEALRVYANRLQSLHPRPFEPSFFISTVGKRLHYCDVHLTFRHLVREVGLQSRSPKCHPRIHDFRHSFAVHTLLGWYRSGADVQSRLPQLSTYLGHVDPVHTYWYLSAAPELMALIAKRLETALGEMP